MKEIAVISGKGGTGKTSLTAAFASLAAPVVLADCDVDAADLHLVMKPEILRQEDFIGGSKARIREEDCTSCGLCVDSCFVEAIAYPVAGDQRPGTVPWINPIFCEGCEVCVRLCPAGAIDIAPAVNGRWFVSRPPCGPMVHAQLGIAQGNSGKLVTLVRQEARAEAEREGMERILVDGPPGVGCPVIAAITGTDLVVVVTEPTLSGRHDLLRVVELTGHFHIPVALCMNKWDIHPELTRQIENEARSLGVALAGRIRYDPLVTKAQIQATSVTALGESPVASDIRNVWDSICKQHL